MSNSKGYEPVELNEERWRVLTNSHAYKVLKTLTTVEVLGIVNVLRIECVDGSELQLSEGESSIILPPSATTPQGKV